MRVIRFTNCAAIGVALMGAAACAPDRQTGQFREARDIVGFTAVSVGGGIDLNIGQGANFSVEIVSEDNNTGGVQTIVEDGTLQIYAGSGSGRFFGLFPSEYSVTVILPTLEAITARGGSDVDAITPLTADKLAIRVSGGSDITAEVQAAELELQANGGSDVDLLGSADVARFEIRGGSELHAGDFVGRDVTIESGGGSDALLTVTESLSANASGGSDLIYLGDPQTVVANATGGADISHR